MKTQAQTFRPLFWRVFTVAKSDATPDENEDAFAVNPVNGKFAIADGATQSAFAAQWARLLVEGYMTRDFCSDPGLALLRQAWANAVDDMEVPWYVAEQREKGAFAAFLGLSLSNAADVSAGRWSAVAIGDTCAFQIRSGVLKSAWPIQHSSQFCNLPRLIGSRDAENDSRLDVKDGTWESGDYFFLMTDALSCWFLSRMESSQNPWNWLRDLTESPEAEERYTQSVYRLRKAGEIKDDDTTLMAIRV